MRAGKRGWSLSGSWSALGSALLLVGIAGCGADEVPPQPLPGEEVFVTMQGALPLEFVMEQLPDGGVTPSAEVSESAIIHGYEVDRYLVDGSMVSIVWIHDPAVGVTEDEDLRTQVNPVVFKDDLMDGWGWEHLDQRAAEWEIRDRSQNGEAPIDGGAIPLDSIPADSLMNGDTLDGTGASAAASEDSESFSF